MILLKVKSSVYNMFKLVRNAITINNIILVVDDIADDIAIDVEVHDTQES